MLPKLFTKGSLENIDSALWTRQAVGCLFEQVSGVVMPIRTVGEYLKRWGMTPQKPSQRAYEQDRQKAWLQTEYPKIQQKAQQQGAEIGWGNKSGVRSDAQVGRGYAYKGETPEIQLNTQRAWVNDVVSIDNQGTVRVMLYAHKLTAEVVMVFLKRLIAQRKRKLLWIVDRHPVHRCAVVQHWLEAHQAQIEMVYLPPYLPPLNPAEYLNCDVKQGVHSKPPTRNQQQLQRRVLSHLRKLQKLSERVMRYFKHPSIAHAA
ncbi:MAG: IS630 family transposase [Synechococcales cyanobacterium C42_A2020_086]|nr:IS630 family transposase [Synechococcales cyanobacterium C42_A2020_086]